MRRLAIILTTLGAFIALLVACSPEGRAESRTKAESGSTEQLWREAAAVQETTAAVNVPNQASLAPLIKQLKPAVVNIYTTTTMKHPRVRTPHRGPQPGDPWSDFFERFFGQPMPMPEEFRSNSLGSGFVLNKEGFVLTNNHVVKDATDIRVKLSDGREFKAKVVGRDPAIDVGLIKLTDAKDLPTVALGDSDKVEQGDFVLAMGNPFNLNGSVSFGIVSAKDRPGVTGSSFDDFIQTDAAINPGNSGGPLFNMRGEVVGINTAIVSPQIGQGIGFAVPINLAKQVLPQLREKGKVARGYLGVTVSDLTADLAQGFGLPEGQKGAVIQQVQPKAPAGKAGLHPGDVVVALNGKPVEGSGQLTRSVSSIPPGGKASLQVLRDGKKKDIAVTVGTRPDEESLARGEVPEGGEEPGEEAVPEGKPKDVKLGVKLAPLSAEMAKDLKLEPGEKGVLVAEVVPDSPAERAGLQRGDLILEVGKEKVSKPEQVVAAVSKQKPGQVVVLRVKRGPAALFVPVRLEKADEKK
ncbi:MAG TPA: DegQ family serine endoprotease [Anaeromyxobacteraceae bacterium]|nr:DegQ family serine endoprotease [Anaeromyxobacteraceae bacterium]